MKQGKLQSSLFTAIPTKRCVEDDDGAEDVSSFFELTPRRHVGSKTPRQTASDRKWEGAAWISPEQLASNVDKRPRRQFNESPDASCGDDGGDSAAAPAMVYPIPKPADPASDKDVTGRRRDKDKIQSEMTWAWDADIQNWKQIPRPRILEVGIFFAYSAIPAKQVVLLEWLHVGTEAPRGGRNPGAAVVPALNADFLRTHLIPRLNRTHAVSLRLLDWLVVDYAREKGIAYRRYFPHLNQHRLVVVYALYFEWLTRWRRRHYDVFRRRHRIYFTLDGQTYSTTVAQLHFFYMAELYGFLDFAEENAAAIEAHMQTKLGITNNIKKTAAEKGETYRRRPLVNKCAPKAYIAEGECVLTFQIGEENTCSGTETSDDDDDDEEDDDEDADKDQDEEEDEDDDGAPSTVHHTET